jgi:tRNA(fMet)-specific endonuclease VapC
MRYLLDTNTCIAAMRGDPGVIARMLSLQPSDCFISTVTAFELFTGVEKCSRPQQELAKVVFLLNSVITLPFDANGAKVAATIRAELERTGQSIGPYDLLIAGHAKTEGLVLATSNAKEFSRVPGLMIEDWNVLKPTAG